MNDELNYIESNALIEELKNRHNEKDIKVIDVREAEAFSGTFINLINLLFV